MSLPVVVVLAASSEIGAGIARRFAERGRRVVGTFRSGDGVAALADVTGVELIRCDLSEPSGIDMLARTLRERDDRWDIFVSAVGRLDPVGLWESLDFDEWERAVRDNSTAQLRVLHALMPHRVAGPVHAAFFAGGGTNGPLSRLSAYCLGKVALIKMCELLHDEIPDLNAFIVGPGFVPTKIHEPVLRDAERAGVAHERTIAFHERASEALGIDDVARCIEWGIVQGREVVGGRNVAAAHDAWATDTELPLRLVGNPDAWRLRRAAVGQWEGTR